MPIDIKLQSNSMSNKLEEYIQGLLKEHPLDDVFFGFYCYASKQAERAKQTNNLEEEIKWKQLIYILDNACDLVEEKKEEHYSYLIY